MKHTLLIFALTAGIFAALAASSQAAPVDDFATTRGHDTGIILNPIGDFGIDASAIARTWPDDAAGAGTFRSFGHGGFAPPADFEALLRDGDGHSLADGIERDPYFALGTWGGDGRAIVHQVIMADAGRHLSGTGDDYAVELAFHGFAVADGRRNAAAESSKPFDGKRMFIPNTGLDLISSWTSPGTGTTGDGGSKGSSGGNGGPGTGDGGGSGSGGSGDPGSGPTMGGGGGLGGGAPSPVPEPGGLLVLLIAMPVALLLQRRRSLARLAVPAMLTAAALMSATGSAKAQLQDWETLCNGTGGATPEVVIEGCSAVIASHHESLDNVAIAYNNRGNAERELGRFDAAKADYDNAIILTPSDPFPYRNRGVTYGLLGDYGRALVDFNHAIALAPKYASAYLGRSFAFEELGKPRAAAADFARAAKLDPHLVAQVHLPQTAALPESH